MMTPLAKPSPRRQFIKTAVASIAVPRIISAEALGNDERTAASDRMTIGVVGLGARGFNLIDQFLKDRDVQIVAVCDVDALHYRDRPWGSGIAYGREPAKKRVDEAYRSSAAAGVTTTSDFHEICERADIDAVVIATPDHWHALCTLRAIHSGKDVYCEKPLTHTFHEGQAIYRTAAAKQTVFQTGSQQRSDPRFIAAAQIARSGKLGRVLKIEVGLPPGYATPQGDVAVIAPPEQLDYDRWCGPAEKLPYMRARHHRWWRGHLAFGGGVLMDWIGHHNDIAHMAIGADRSGPLSVEAVGWTFPETSVYNTPHQYEIRCRYPAGIESTISSRHAEGLKIIGEDGWVFVRRGKLAASDPRWIAAAHRSGPAAVDEVAVHTRNFVDCFRSRRECVAPAEVGHRSVTPGHLGYVAHAMGRPLRWDASKEEVVADDEANRRLQRHEYRPPWDQHFAEMTS